MDRPKTNPVSVITIGIVVLVLFSIPLFWARHVCETALLTVMPEDFMELSISPSGLVPVEIEKDADVELPSTVRVHTYREPVPAALGIADYLARRTLTGNMLVGPYLDIYESNGDAHPILHFDRTTGLLVYRYYDVDKLPDGGKRVELVQAYAGPEGVAETPDPNLGRFMDLLDSGRWHTCLVDGNEPRRWTELRLLYDKKLRQFFAVDFRERTVRKSPTLPSDHPANPVQLGRLTKNLAGPEIDFDPPRRFVRLAPDDSGKPRFARTKHGGLRWESLIAVYCGHSAQRNSLVLDESGRIDLLSLETLQFMGTAGHLPTARATGQIARPKDLFVYDVESIALGNPPNFVGTCVAAVPRERTTMTLAIYDSNGRLIKEKTAPATDLPKYQYPPPPPKEDLFDFAWGPALMIAKFVVENLQPPALSIASYFTADTFEAVAGHRALFLLPNSFVAIKARDSKAKTWGRGLVAGLLMAPSIVLAFFLCWLVNRDAVTIGLSENARSFWFVFTFAFGLAGYLTYLLTRPKITLVTCQSCGRGRRPDMRTCHRCSSKWIVPELTPPAWRVIDEQTSTEDAPNTQLPQG
jgi:hypothetical protein